MRPGAKARGDELKQTLIDAVESRLAAHGLRTLSVRQLAADARCGAGTIGYVFGSLDNLILLANERTLTQIAGKVDETLYLTQRAGRAERMQALALAYLDYAQANRNRWEAAFLQTLPLDGAVPDWYAVRRDGLIGKVAAIIEPDRADDPKILMLARTVFAAVHGVVLLGLDRKLGDLRIDECRHRVMVLISLLEAGLGRDYPSSNATDPAHSS